MANNLFTTAIKDGKYVSIDEFHSGVGAQCGCICPECGEPVLSNVTKKKKEELKVTYTNHFSHRNKNSACSGGHEETQIHLKAKEIIASSTSINVPGQTKGITSTIEYTHVRLEPAFPHPEFKKYRPDINVTTLEGEDVAIEVVVTCEVTDVKKQLYVDNKFKSLVIDLATYKDRDLKKVEVKLKKSVLTTVDNKKWIWPELVEETHPNQIDSLPEQSPVTTNKVSSFWENPWVWFIGIIIMLYFFFRKRK